MLKNKMLAFQKRLCFDKKKAKKIVNLLYCQTIFTFTIVKQFWLSAITLQLLLNPFGGRTHSCE